MSAEPGTKVRGTIVKVPDATPGLLFINGQQKQFSLEGTWKSAVAPAPNMTVDVNLDGAGEIAAITVVDSQKIAQERLSQLGGVVNERGAEGMKLAKQGLEVLTGRLGKIALAAVVLLWISWFFFSAATVQNPGGGNLSFTFWALLGTDFNNLESLAGGGANHGFFAFLGLIAIAAPFAAPFLRASWSKYLNAAPLAYFVIAFVAIYMNESKAFADLSKMGVANPFSWSWLIIFPVIAAMVLAAGAWKKPVTA
jgi:hypothetical protein